MEGKKIASSNKICEKRTTRILYCKCNILPSAKKKNSHKFIKFNRKFPNSTQKITFVQPLRFLEIDHCFCQKFTGHLPPGNSFVLEIKSALLFISVIHSHSILHITHVQRKEFLSILQLICYINQERFQKLFI